MFSPDEDLIEQGMFCYNFIIRNTAFNNLGMAYQKKKYYDKAIVFLKKAISRI